MSPWMNAIVECPYCVFASLLNSYCFVFILFFIHFSLQFWCHIIHKLNVCILFDPLSPRLASMLHHVCVPRPHERYGTKRANVPVPCAPCRSLLQRAENFMERKNQKWSC